MDNNESNRRKILLLGKNGQVGWELQRTLAPLGNVVALDQEELDLVRVGDIRSTVQELKPDIIVNAAAYTAVDKAESEPDLAMAINGDAPGVLAEEAKKLGALLVHYSTDYVFDGTKDTPYTEEDIPNPLNVYGKTKLAGEQAIQALNGNYLIFRTSWVYGTRGQNFFLTMLRLAREHEEIRVVDDQVGCPTWCGSIAERTANVLSNLIDKYHFEHNKIFHLSSVQAVSWFSFATKIFSVFKNEQFRLKRIIPINSSQYMNLARRPKYSVLSNQKIIQTFKLNNESTSIEDILRLLENGYNYE
jgi:dTDP-4-dehydrorhamnose reductase